MKLGEALTERAEATRRVEQLRTRIAAVARYQEGEEPAEDASALLVELHAVLDRLQQLIVQINLTNAQASADGSGESLTSVPARRDVLRLRHGAVTAAADAAAGRNQPSMARQMRSELRMLSALPVGGLRAEADTLAQQLRQLDVGLQRANWEVDLVE